MEKDNSQSARLVVFVVLSSLILLGYPALMQKFFPRPPAAQKAGEAGKDQAAKDKAVDGKQVADKQPAAKQADGAAPPVAPAVVAPVNQAPEQWATLGSADPASGYRMLVTLTNVGAAVDCIELNDSRYPDTTHRETRPSEDFSGWIGYIGETTNADPPGALVRVVGRATPGDKAGLKVGDVITQFNDRAIGNYVDYAVALKATRPGTPIKLTIQRSGQSSQLDIVAIQRPIRITHAESSDPLSFLLSVDSLDGSTVADGSNEMAGMNLRTGRWQTTVNENEVVFTWPLAAQGLEIVKRYSVEQAPTDKVNDRNYRAYHLKLAVEIRNRGMAQHTLAYRLDGPTGLPIEGSWYAQKISRQWWDAAGVRDMVAGFRKGEKFAYHDDRMVSCPTIAKETRVVVSDPNEPLPLRYAGVDSLYFASALLPAQDNPAEVRFSQVDAMLVGKVPAEAADRKLSNVSCRLVSQRLELPAGAETIHQFEIFAGPKRPDLLQQYGMGDLIYYGWFDFTAVPLLRVLHFFYDYFPIHNYGIAIIMLTVLVRSCLFPITRKQALGAQKMQEIQPELKKIAEKYKDDMNKRNKAQQELFAKHNYNPLSGCLPVFLQLPIFIGLYRSISLDIELRGSPLIPGIQWASNLCAPDMLWYWESYLPAVLGSPNGWLGPYLNILPLATIGLFLWQQQVMMPPAVDEQTRTQQKVMKYMMIFMGLLFFKVAAGLCVYFIASSLWSMAERKFLPKSNVPAAGTSPNSPRVIDVTTVKPGENGNKSSSQKKAKERGE